MIDISAEVRQTGGIIPAITLKCAKLMKEHLEGAGIKLGAVRGAKSKIERILTHAEPHIDEYMAALVIRAVLPDNKKLIPLIPEIVDPIETDPTRGDLLIERQERHASKSLLAHVNTARLRRDSRRRSKGSTPH